MISPEIVDLTSDDGHIEVNIKAVKTEQGLVGLQNENNQKVLLGQLLAVKREKHKEQSQNSNTVAAGHSKNSVLEQPPSPVDDTSLASSSARHPAPISRQFWKAGSYSDVISSDATLQNGNNGIHIHPMFLHSNATSHKWAFGAVAELIDNAFDEIQNGATYVFLDKVLNPRDGTPALLVRDDGGGMDPEAMRRCMSFGFSEKKSGIGQYGNGFKTSTMRLGADVIVFSRHFSNGALSQSAGLLSYTFLTQTGHNRIVVPMFNDIGYHGTKVIVYNLWHDDDGKLELDFDVDPEDIVLGGVTKKIHTTNARKGKNEAHVANRLQHSLRAYLSIMYLRVPENFRIILRGQDVEHYNIATDLKHPEFILYKPHSAGHLEGTILTSIGFVKDAPEVMVHGFNVYHKNRLILPFWRVLDRGRGVVGVLEANFIEPTHNKQDFERTSLFQKLETRLRLMTAEYWDLHCHLLGFRPRCNTTTEKAMKDSVQSQQTSCIPSQPTAHGLSLSQHAPAKQTQVVSLKRTSKEDLHDAQYVKRQAVGSEDVGNPNGGIMELKSVNDLSSQRRNPEYVALLQVGEKLQRQCLEFETEERELASKVEQLQSELLQVQHEYQRLQAEANLLDLVKQETAVYIHTV
uniref:Morc S5 domain-containing protein n=1 Tax=Kalanchoe fedtschenkoi TaxID=63787 RepID=A0A7N0RBA1_KALFE